MAVRASFYRPGTNDHSEDYEPMQYFSYLDDYEVIYDEWEEDWDLLNPKHLASAIEYGDLTLGDPEEEIEESVFPVELQ